MSESISFLSKNFLLTVGKLCPSCGLHAVRYPPPLLLRIVQHLLFRRFTYRYCSRCDTHRMHLG